MWHRHKMRRLLKKTFRIILVWGSRACYPGSSNLPPHIALRLPQFSFTKSFARWQELEFLNSAAWTLATSPFRVDLTVDALVHHCETSLLVFSLPVMFELPILRMFRLVGQASAATGATSNQLSWYGVAI